MRSAHLQVSTTLRQSPRRAVVVLSALLAMSLACSKDPKTDPAAAAPAAPSADPAPSAPATPAAASADPAPSDAGKPNAQVAAATPHVGTATKPAASGHDATPAPSACGTKPLPDCPLQAWMKANTAPAMASNDFAAIATALDKIVTFAPAGYTNWASISKDGAAAARASKLDAVKAACRGCHDQYRTKYRTERRAQPIS